MSSRRYDGPNLVLKYDSSLNRLVNIAVDDRNSPYYALRDTAGNAIGVTACDVDGDGREEIYFLNTNNAYSGKQLILTKKVSIMQTAENLLVTDSFPL